uniref:Uncharacterized protein n=1 Tax=Physcomitrium patens TaxID=3218 RepID=A0A7I4B609_PHYPA
MLAPSQSQPKTFFIGRAKKKLGSRNATAKKAKSMLIEHKTILEGSPSLKTLSEANETTLDTSNLKTCIGAIEVAVESTFRGCTSESPVVAEALDLKEEPKCWSITSGLKLQLIWRTAKSIIPKITRALVWQMHRIIFLGGQSW